MSTPGRVEVVHHDRMDVLYREQVGPIAQALAEQLYSGDGPLHHLQDRPTEESAWPIILRALRQSFMAGARAEQADTAAELQAIVQKVRSLVGDSPHLRRDA